MRYGHIVTAFYSKPWAILPETLAIMEELLWFRVNGGRLSHDEIEARVDAARQPRQQAQPPKDVAMLQLYGVIAPRASMLEETSTGGTGLDSFMGAFRSAMANPEVKSIVMDIDSPGGQVGGVPEAAAEIRAAREQKPITAFANVGIGAASAAYYLGSQASEFVASPSSEVGSIGVRMVHQDKSAMFEKLGVKHTIISAGKYKDEGNPYGPLAEETIAYAQGQIDTIYSGFLNDVAKGRRLPLDTVKADFGEGRMLDAKDALKAGMVDRIDTLDGVIRRELARPTSGQVTATVLGPGWAAEDDTPAVDAPVDEPATDEPETAGTDFAFELELRRRRAANG